MKNKMEDKEKKKITKQSVKKWLKKNAPLICVSLAAFVLLVGVLIVVFQAEEELVQYEIKNENLYTYSLNHRLDFYTQVTLDHEDNVTKMLYNGEEITLFTEPIYYVGKKVAIFPRKMTVVFPINGRIQRKINRYTRVNAEGLQVVAMNTKLKYALTDSFIFDGGDVYFFNEDGVIAYGDKKIEVSKFSFIRCEYRGSLSIYDYKKDEMIFDEEVKENVIAEFKNYSINMSNDSIIVYGEPSLIDKNIDSQTLLSNSK